MKTYKIGILGLGYVGLPLAVAFSSQFDVVGFDINSDRIRQLQSGIDENLEISTADFAAASKNLRFTSDVEALRCCNFYIVTVPTPVDRFKVPDLQPLLSACQILTGLISKGDIIVFESTVFPGTTREICIPALMKENELVLNVDFFVGYSPERINPGDRERGVSSIIKVTSGSNEFSAEAIDSVYRKIITVGTHKAASIEVAEAAKVIENTQRDVNIALVNELSMFFSELKLDTKQVLEAASTKWNFLNFQPGLVGGHCIGVDPYYLIYKAREVNFDAKMITAGRGINDGMAKFAAQKLLAKTLEQGFNPKMENALILGCTFKENCPDTRNSKVLDYAHELARSHHRVDISDPYLKEPTLNFEGNIEFCEAPDLKSYASVTLAVPHQQYLELGVAQIKEYLIDNGILFDLKSVFEIAQSDLRL